MLRKWKGGPGLQEFLIQMQEDRLERARSNSPGEQGSSDLAMTMIRAVTWCSYISGLKLSKLNKNHNFQLICSKYHSVPLFLLWDMLLSPRVNIIFGFLPPSLPSPSPSQMLTRCFCQCFLFCFVCFRNNEIKASEIPFFLQLSKLPSLMILLFVRSSWFILLYLPEMYLEEKYTVRKIHCEKNTLWEIDLIMPCTPDFQTDFTGSYIMGTKLMHWHSSESQRHSESWQSSRRNSWASSVSIQIQGNAFPFFSGFKLLSSQKC